MSETPNLPENATWDRPDFADPRFSIRYVTEAATCRHEGCDRLAAHLVEYDMRRDGWVYDYQCGYCNEHLPQQARDFGDDSPSSPEGAR